MPIHACEHVPADLAQPHAPHGCEDCLKTGDTWVHLRLCVHCGHVGCCDSSKNRHATKHARAEGHPVIQSIEPGEHWMWCNAHERQVG
ncbi:putative UBP type Zn finger protein [Variovorax boronicumulans]|uniref:UBP-type zinc finger domain-containing protein n=1 Tax=Variovorax boronicumulans TaxID=436515 RepID=UPI002782462B|nr:UBP-type zinc finger domain-containing protein [Variovorax boronicumulans]MDP9918228.1 putative UBP type Zn finger protein [Variovorax boronicumulans]